MFDFGDAQYAVARPSLPLVRLTLILPFVEALDERGTGADTVLARNGLVRGTVLDPDVFVPSIVVHRFLEDAAEAAGDRHLGVRVGEALALDTWPPFIDSVSRASTLGEFLICFIRAARDEASSAHHCLKVHATHAYFIETRSSEPEIVPAQNDAFMAALTLGLLRGGAGERWDSSQVRLKVSDVSALPARYRGTSIFTGDRMGMAVRFPTEWLSNAIDRAAFTGGAFLRHHRLRVPVDFLDALRQALVMCLHEAPPGVDEVARLVGMSRQSLQRRLKANGTTLSREISALRRQRATDLLTESRRKVAEIAFSLGFSNPTSFTRAFKDWTGESPREYRKKRQAQACD